MGPGQETVASSPPAEWAGVSPLVDWDFAKVLITAGSAVDSVPDQSGRGITLTSNASNKPVRVTASANFNGTNTVSFTGVQSATCGNPGVAVSGPITIIVVAKVTGGSNNPFANFAVESANEHIAIYADAASHWGEWLNSGFTGVISTVLETVSSAVLATLSAGTQRLYVNSATEIGNAASASFDITAGLTVGNKGAVASNVTLGGEVARIIIWNSILTLGQRTATLAALGARYGLTIT